MTMYERIEELRKSKNISQGKLESLLGFSNGSISKWKNSTPNPERLKKLADYFGVTTDYLISGDNPTKNKENTITDDILKQVEQISEVLVKNHVSQMYDYFINKDDLQQEILANILDGKSLEEATTAGKIYLLNARRKMMPDMVFLEKESSEINYDLLIESKENAISEDTANKVSAIDSVILEVYKSPDRNRLIEYAKRLRSVRIMESELKSEIDKKQIDKK